MRSIWMRQIRMLADKRHLQAKMTLHVHTTSEKGGVADNALEGCTTSHDVAVGRNFDLLASWPPRLVTKANVFWQACVALLHRVVALAMQRVEGSQNLASRLASSLLPQQSLIQISHGRAVGTLWLNLRALAHWCMYDVHQWKQLPAGIPDIAPQ